MHRISRAPVLSATFSRDLLLDHDAPLQDLDQAPALGAAERPALDHAHRVAHVGLVALVVRVQRGGRAHDLPVARGAGARSSTRTVIVFVAPWPETTTPWRTLAAPRLRLGPAAPGPRAAVAGSVLRRCLAFWRQRGGARRPCGARSRHARRAAPRACAADAASPSKRERAALRCCLGESVSPGSSAAGASAGAGACSSAAGSSAAGSSAGLLRRSLLRRCLLGSRLLRREPPRRRPRVPPGVLGLLALLFVLLLF